MLSNLSVFIKFMVIVINQDISKQIWLVICEFYNFLLFQVCHMFISLISYANSN
jgi:hypothetical protein